MVLCLLIVDLLAKDDFWYDLEISFLPHSIYTGKKFQPRVYFLGFSIPDPIRINLKCSYF